MIWLTFMVKELNSSDRKRRRDIFILLKDSTRIRGRHCFHSYHDTYTDSWYGQIHEFCPLAIDQSCQGQKAGEDTPTARQVEAK